MSFVNDLRVAFRSLTRTRGLALTVVLTLALGIGANAAIFTLVRGVLLKPLVNRDEDRLIYIRQSAPGVGADNAAFSVPEIEDLRSRVRTLSAFGDFSTVGFTMIGLGQPREVQAGVVGGTYFDVMGLHPVLGRLIGPQDDGPSAAGVVVLTYRFWATGLKKDPSVIGKAVRLDSGVLGNRSATIIGVLEPSVPYPQDTEIIANVVTSPHHLSATMVTGRIHRMTELVGRLAPGVTLDRARAELRAVYGAMIEGTPRSLFSESALPDRGETVSRPDHLGRPDRVAGAARGLGAGLRHRVFQCRQPDSHPDGSPRGRAHDPCSARGQHGRAPPHAAGRKPSALQRRRRSRCPQREADGDDPGPLRLALFGPRARPDGRFQPALGGSRADRRRGGDPGIRPAPAVGRCVQSPQPIERQRTDDRQHEPPSADLRGDANRGILRTAGRRQHVDHYADRTASGEDRCRHPPRPCRQRPGHVLRKDTSAGARFLQGIDSPRGCATGREKDRVRPECSLARCRRPCRPAVLRRRSCACRRRRGSSRAVARHLSRILCRARRSDPHRS